MYRKIGITVLKDKQRQTLVKAAETDFSQKLLTGGERAELHSNLCRGNWAFYRDYEGWQGGLGISRVREVKNYKRLVSVNAIKPAVSASWQLSKESIFPQILEDRSPNLPDDYSRE